MRKTGLSCSDPLVQRDWLACSTEFLQHIVVMAEVDAQRRMSAEVISLYK
jgi:hypothetical protein